MRARTYKNILDRQHIVRFRKSQQVLYHSTLLYNVQYILCVNISIFMPNCTGPVLNHSTLTDSTWGRLQYCSYRYSNISLSNQSEIQSYTVYKQNINKEPVNRLTARVGHRAFFSVRYVPFFKKNVPFFSVLFSSFWRLMRPKRTFRSFPFFSKERKRTQRTQRSVAKNVKERKECNVLLQRT